MEMGIIQERLYDTKRRHQKITWYLKVCILALCFLMVLFLALAVYYGYYWKPDRNWEVLQMGAEKTMLKHQNKTLTPVLQNY